MARKAAGGRGGRSVKTLVIVESPSKAKHIQHILGSGYTVAASMGHVRDLPAKRMGIAPPRFDLEYETTSKGSAVLRRLRQLVKTAGAYVLATDPDREGEAIAWHLKAALRLPDSRARRVTYHAVTEAAVREAFGKPRGIDMNLVRAQEARRGLDRLVGYTLSGAVSDAVRERASAGRVQTPALRLVVERERERRAFRSTLHFGARLFFDGFAADWDTKPHLGPGEKYLLDRTLAERAAAVRRVRVAEAKRKIRVRGAPPPHTTSTLLQEAAKAGIPGTRAMAAAQALFEAGRITYHRTDSVHIEPEAVAAIRDYAAERGYAVPERPNAHKTRSAAAQEAHEAIRPTDIRLETAGDGGDVSRLYTMIHRRALASQLAPERAEVLEAVLVSEEPGDLAGFRYKTSTIRVLEPGFAVIYPRPDTAGAAREPLREGERLTAKSGKVRPLCTEPPPRYTEASLIKALERRGIGRPSTWASILDTLRRRRYIEPVPGSKPASSEKPASCNVKPQARRAAAGLDLAPTPLGERLIDAVSETAFAAYDYTAEMEKRLDMIACGKAEFVQVMADGYAEIRRDLARIAVAGRGSI